MVIDIRPQQSKGQPPDAKKEQAIADGKALHQASQKDGAMGIKAKIKDQILKAVTVHGKLLLYWKRQPGTGYTYPFIFPLWLAVALQTDIEKVCECITEMIDTREIQTIGNVPKPVTAAVLVEHVHRWDEVAKNPAQAGKVQGKMSLLLPFAATGKARQYTAEQIESHLL